MIMIDMPMPKDCRDCPLKMPCNYCEGYTDKCVIERGNGHYVTAYENGRLPDCPLREVSERQIDEYVAWPEKEIAWDIKKCIGGEE